MDIYRRGRFDATITHRDRAQLPTTQGIWSTALTTDRQGRRRHVGHRTETWARQTKHADEVTWFLSKLQAEARAGPNSEMEWSGPTARSDRAYNWGDSAIAPDSSTSTDAVFSVVSSE